MGSGDTAFPPPVAEAGLGPSGLHLSGRWTSHEILGAQVWFQEIISLCLHPPPHRKPPLLLSSVPSLPILFSSSSSSCSGPQRPLPHSLSGWLELLISLAATYWGQALRSPGGQGPRGLRRWFRSGLEDLFFTPCPLGPRTPHSLHSSSRSVVLKAPSHRKSVPPLAVPRRTLNSRVELGFPQWCETELRPPGGL